MTSNVILEGIKVLDVDVECFIVEARELDLSIGNLDYGIFFKQVAVLIGEKLSYTENHRDFILFC